MSADNAHDTQPRHGDDESAEHDRGGPPADPAQYDEDRDVTVVHQRAPAGDPGRLPPLEHPDQGAR